jgi:hypothetical protein
VKPVSEVQNAKACAPMSVTEAGIVTVASTRQPRNAWVPMEVTVDGIETLRMAF